jgi:superfamily II DNA or RNA helicase
MPVSWRGTIQQYVGRLHRIHHGKRVVCVYDYVDALVPMLARMYEKRLKRYKAIGYTIETQSDTPRRAGGLMGWAASKAVGGFI